MPRADYGWLFARIARIRETGVQHISPFASAYLGRLRPESSARDYLAREVGFTHPMTTYTMS